MIAAASAATPIRLLVVNELPPEGGGSYVDYAGASPGGPSWEREDVGSLIRERQQQWLDELEQWHRDMSGRALRHASDWWLLRASRFAAWYPVDLRPLWMALGVMELCGQGTARPTLYLVGFPDESLDYIREWAESEPSDTVQLSSDPSSGASTAPTSQKGTAWLVSTAKLFALLIMRRAAARRRRRPTVPRAGVLVVSYAPSAAVVRQTGDHFFGTCLDTARTEAPETVHWLYLLGDFGDRDDVRAACESLGRDMTFDFELLRWRDLVAILLRCLRIGAHLNEVARVVPPLRVGRLRSVAFQRRFARSAVTSNTPVLELGVYHSVKRGIQALAPAVVVYPYEEKPLERSILRACAEHRPPLRTVGFMHAGFTPGHLYARYQEETGRPGPTKLAVTGPAARDWLVKWARVPEERIFVAGSPRAAASEPRGARAPGAPLRVLFAAGVVYEIGRLATMAEEIGDLFSGTELIIRRHPTDFVALQDVEVARLQRACPAARVYDAPLLEQIRWSDVVLFSSTSAALEAVLLGRVVVRIVGDAFDTDLFHDKPGREAIPVCETAAELRQKLAEIAALDDREYTERCSEQLHAARGIYADWDSAAFAQAVQDLKTPGGGPPLATTAG